MKKQFRRAASLFWAIFLLVILCVPAVQAAGNSLSISVTEIFEEDGVKYAALRIDNYTGARVSFGWVDSCEVVVTTDQGLYSREVSSFTKVNQGSYTMKLSLGSARGTVQKIVLTDLRQLKDSGLPGNRMKNVVIYDIAKGISSYEGKFSIFSTTAGTMMVVAPIFMVVVIVLMVLFVLRTLKANKQATQPFAPTSAAADAAQQQMHQQMHQQAVQEQQRFMEQMQQQMQQQAVNDHQQLMNQQEVQDHQQFMNQQHEQFAHQSVTPINEGGFTPPPPPPAGF